MLASGPQSLANSIMDDYSTSPNGDGQTLHFYHDGMFSRSISIFANDKQTLLYNVELHSMRKPHVRLRAAASSPTDPSASSLTNPSGPLPEPIGTVTFHRMSNRIDLALHGSETTANKINFWKWGRQYISPWTAGAEVTWKRNVTFTKRNCDLSFFAGPESSQVEIARFENANWARSKEGKLHVSPQAKKLGFGLDELVLMAAAAHEQGRREAQRGSAAAASAGGASC